MDRDLKLNNFLNEVLIDKINNLRLNLKHGINYRPFYVV